VAQCLFLDLGGEFVDVAVDRLVSQASLRADATAEVRERTPSLS